MNLSVKIKEPLASLEKSLDVLVREFRWVPARHYPALLRDMIVCGKAPDAIEEAVKTYHRYFPTQEMRRRLVRNLGKKNWVNFLFFVEYQKKDLKKLAGQMLRRQVGERLLQAALYLKKRHRAQRFFRYRLKTVELLKQGLRPQSGQKVVIVFSPYKDHNNAFAKLHELVQGLSDQGYAVQHRELKRPRAALRWMRFRHGIEAQEGIIIEGHGYRTGLALGDSKNVLNRLETRNEALLREMLSFVKPGGFVILKSCRTAQGKDSLGSVIAKMAPKVEVQAHACEAVSKIEFDESRPRLFSLCRDENGQWEKVYRKARVFNDTVYRRL